MSSTFINPLLYLQNLTTNDLEQAKTSIQFWENQFKPIQDKFNQKYDHEEFAIPAQSLDLAKGFVQNALKSLDEALKAIQAASMASQGNTESTRQALTQRASEKMNNNPPIDLSLQRIRNPPRTKLEHHVASWATTMVIQVFEEVKDNQGRHQWIYTPEQRDLDSNKIPDFIVETTSSGQRTPRLFLEYKKVGGDPMFAALDQLTNAIKSRLGENYSDLINMNTPGKIPTIYLCVVAGTKISFWEMDKDANAAEDKTYHLWCCRSILQRGNWYGEENLVHNRYAKFPVKTIDGSGPKYDEEHAINDKLPLGVERIAQPGSTNNELGKEAEEYVTPVVWDFNNPDHKGPIREIFEHIARYEPRGW